MAEHETQPDGRKRDEAGERRRRIGLRVLPVNKIIPNVLTLGALSAGLTGIRFAMDEKWEPAAFAILIAAILDMLDGRVARLLKGASKFGAELDSLSDIVCFGVAPALIVYMWGLEEIGRFGWIFTIFFPLCCALRLARFNTALEDESKPVWAGRFFTGVPAPAGAGLCLLPMILSFTLPEEFAPYLRHPATAAFALIVAGSLFVSTMPTYSFKNMKLAKTWLLPIMLLVVVLVGLIVTDVWLALSTILVLYIVGFPFSIRSYLWHKKRS